MGHGFRAGQPGPHPAGPAARGGDLAGQRVGAGVRRDGPGGGHQVGGTGHPLDGRPGRVRAGRARVRGDLPRGVGDRVDPEAAVHLGLQRGLVREVRQFRDPPGQQLGRGLPGPLQPLDRLLPGRVAGGQLRPALQFAGAGPEHPGDRADRGGVLGRAQLARRDAGQDFQRLEQPAQLVDEPGQGGRGAGRPGRPVRRGGQPAAQPGDRLPRRGQGGGLGGLATAEGIGQRGQGQAALGRVRPQRRAFPRRPERHHGQDADDRGQAPAGQPPAGLGHRRGHRHGQHEDQDRGGPCGREVAVDHPGEQDEEPDHEHGPGGEPGIAGARGTHHDQDRAADRERQVGEEPAAGGPAERDEHQDGQRPERGVQRGLRLADHLVGEREDRGHHDARPGGALERDQAGIVDRGRGIFIRCGCPPGGHPVRNWSTRSYTGRCSPRRPATAGAALLTGGAGWPGPRIGVPFPRPGPYLRVRAPLCCASGGVTTHYGVLGGRPMAAKVGSRP